MPLYLSEVAPTEIRGEVASLNQIMIVSAFIVNYALSKSESRRWILGLAAIPSAILLIVTLFIRRPRAGS